MLVCDPVDEARQHETKAVVVATSVPHRADCDREAAVVGVHFECHRVAIGRVKDAENRQLKVVHALVREICAAPDTAEDEGRDATEPCAGRDGQDDSVTHIDLGSERAVRPEKHLNSDSVGMSDDFDVQTEMVPGGAVVLRVSGELDLASVPRLEEALATVSADPTVIDLSECTFLDSSAVRMLASAGRRLSEAGRRFAIVASNPGLLRVLEITGVDTMLAVHHSTESALAAPSA